MEYSGSGIFRDNIGNEFMNRIISILGPVLLGAKPAELISLPKYDNQLANKLEDIEKYIGKSRIIYYRMFEYKNTSIKVLFYNPKALNDHLEDKRNFKFLTAMGYPKEYCLYGYLQSLINKIEQGYIPDEIGIFLGYPLKDVIGFMGHPSLKLTKIDSWRVYGDPEISDKKLKEIYNAKCKIKSLLNQYTPERVLFSV